MSAAQDYSEISVLIPGHSVEDLPTDLSEEDAESLLNAIACAWHPRLLLLSGGIPVFRQAESLTEYPGRRIVFVPSTSESWMPHEWRKAFSDQGHIVLAGYSKRDAWIAAIDQALAVSANTAETDGQSVVSKSPAGNEVSVDQSLASPPLLVDHFLALGISMMQVHLLSRRRHHFVDADKILLSRESGLAANAAVSGDEIAVKFHLSNCFEHLRDTRERFYPTNCYLMDFCIPGDEEPVSGLDRLISSTTSATRFNLFATGRDLARWVQQEPSFGNLLKKAIEDELVSVLTGHDTETRSSLGTMAATVNDLERARQMYLQIVNSPPRHWARRRYGMTASIPSLLSYYGFESALHFALDDGLYPDKEFSQFLWQAPDGSQIPAASRIPLAIDSAAGFLRFADRYNESMQDDNTAAIFLAHLPSLKAPWLSDLQTATTYAPVFGEFATMDILVHACSSTCATERYQHSEYLAPYLIQASVLKSEAPVSGPAHLRQLSARIESLRVLLAMARQVNAEGDVNAIDAQFTQIETELGSLELQHVDFTREWSTKEEAIKAASLSIESQLDSWSERLASALQSRIPQRPAEARGLLIINTIPFGRLVNVSWPASWKRPVASKRIELAERTNEQEQLLVRLPPGGFVWLSEAGPGQSPQPILHPIRREPPLAESLTLRNRHFEVTLSDSTGAIASVTYHQQRGNRLSQQACFRFEREQVLPDDGSGEIRKSAYSTPHLTTHRVLHAGTVNASIETTSDLRSPVDGSTLAIVRQITSIDRVQPRILVTLVFDRLVTHVQGNPWLTYFGCRFAWDNEAASVTRSVMGHAAGFRSDRFESPDYVEISDTDHRVVIATHGRPYHRRSGPRMLDSLLIVENEPGREFQFTIEFDQSFPLRTSADAGTLPIITETSGSSPISDSSWILGLSARNVELVHSKVRSATNDSAEELSLMLTETEGVSANCLIRTARRPTAAFVVNADRSRKSVADVTDQGVVVSLDAFQLKEVLLIL